MPTDPMADTGDFEDGPLIPQSRGPTSAVTVRVGGESHRGHVRANNEDCYYISRFGRSLHTILTNVPEEYTFPPLQEVGYGMLVADGMGGQAAGEVASRSAVQTLSELMRATPDWIFADDEAQIDIVMGRMSDRFREIDRMLNQKAAKDPSLAGMGTTLTLAVSLGFDLILCHIGDSRAYLFRDGALQQLTRDMTVAQDLIDSGKLDPSERRARRLGHALTQCLGLGHAKSHAQRHVLRDRDRLLLCSDGLTDMLSDAEVADVLRHVVTPEEAAHRLVKHALQAGGHDNATVIVADYRQT